MQEIISYFAKLAIINPILNSIFGGAAGFQLLPTLVNAFGGGGTPALLQTGAAVAGMSGDFNMGGFSGAAGGASSLFSGSSWISYGKSLWNGFSTGLSGFWNGTGGAGAFNMGGYSGVTGTAGYGSALTQGLGIAGGIYAGWNRA